MHPDCIEEIARAVGRPITAEEGNRYQQALERHGRELARENPAEWRKLSLSQRVLKAAEAAHRERLGKATKDAQRKAGNLLAQTREAAHLTERAPAMKGKNKHHRALFERLRQVENYVNGVRHEAMASVMDAIQAVEPRFLRLIDNPEAVQSFVREAYAVAAGHEPGKATGSTIAGKAAMSYLQAMETLRERMNAAGADVGKLAYAYLPQPHDVGKIARTDKRRWIEDVAPLANRNRYVNVDGTRMNDREFADYLGAIYDAISTEGRATRVPGTGSGGQFSALATRKDDQHRLLHFKGPDAHLKYLHAYGRGSMLEGIVGHVNQSARTIGLLESLGPNPGATFRLLKDTAEKLDNVQGAREAFATPEMVWDTLTGVVANPVSPSLAAKWQTVRNYVTAAKLQGVMLSALTDAPMQMLAAKYNGMPIGETLITTLEAFGHDRADAASRIGLATESISTEMAQWHADNLAQNWSHHLANTTMRLTLVEAWTHALRRGFGLTLSATLGKMRAAAWEALSEFDRSRLTTAGVTAEDWRIWQRAELVTMGSQALLTKDGVRAVTGEAPEALNRATARLLGFIDQEAHMAVLSPDIMTRAAINQGSRAGTVGGEFLRTLMLFKSFSVAMLVKHIRRIQSLPDTRSRAAYSVAMASSLTLFGALVLQLKEIAAGRDPRDMRDGGFWGAAFSQGGGAGIIGDLFYTGMKGDSRGGQSNWTSAFGPAFGTAFDAADIANDWRKEAMGEDTKANAKMVRFARGNLPLVNLWYLRAAIDHLVMHDLQEQVSPGYLRKMRQRTMRDFGQDYWWRPGEKLPARAPSLEAATGGR